MCRNVSSLYPYLPKSTLFALQKYITNILSQFLYQSVLAITAIQVMGAEITTLSIICVIKTLCSRQQEYPHNSQWLHHKLTSRILNISYVVNNVRVCCQCGSISLVSTNSSYSPFHKSELYLSFLLLKVILQQQKKNILFLAVFWHTYFLYTTHTYKQSFRIWQHNESVVTLIKLSQKSISFYTIHLTKKAKIYDNKPI